MAADHTDKPVNGTYGAHQSYGQPESYQATQGSNPSPASTNGPAVTAPTDTDEKPIPKEMIGWYFVEQYYNTMSKDPKSLFLYYTKRSQFVSGDEAEKVQVAVGQKAISERIKELDIQDCKVRVSNVDTQESFKNILVQVIGEMSNKAAPHRKFVQTFVLAEQPTGYFVLNDIFRYIIEEEDEIENGETANDETTPSAPPPAAETTTLSTANSAQQQHAVEEVDKKLEESALQKTSSLDSTPTDVTPANGAPAPKSAVVNHAEDAPVAAIKETGEQTEKLQKAAESVAAEEEAQSEKPRDPEPTPVASPPKSTKAAPTQTQAPAAPAAPAAPVKPAAPKTWANLVAANRTAGSAVPNGTAPATAAVPAPSKPKAAPSSTKESLTPPTSTNDESPIKTQHNGNTGWQMAGSENKKQQGRQHSQSVSSGQDNVLGYVKNVTEKVDASILKETLNHFGKLVYFDVSRQKNCAFVEFADSAAYAAAVAANPHSIGGEQIFVEERRPRGNAYGGNFGNRGGMRGGRGGTTDRPGNQGRGGFTKDGGRGGYGPRNGRGGAVTPRGRGGQPQAA